MRPEKQGPTASKSRYVFAFLITMLVYCRVATTPMSAQSRRTDFLVRLENANSGFRHAAFRHFDVKQM